MNFRTTTLRLLLVSLFAVSGRTVLAQSQDIAINKTFSCRIGTGVSSMLIKKGKVLTAKAASSEAKKLNVSLGKLKEAFIEAKAGKNKKAIARAKAKLDAGKLLKTSVQSCIKGNFAGTPSTTPTPTPTTNPTPTQTVSPTPTIAFPLTVRGGSYTGTWNNTTFNSSGGIALTLQVTGNTGFSLVLDLGGNVFGGGDPAAETFTGTFTGSPPYVFTYNSPLFGPNTKITVSANGDFQIDAPDPTSAVITNYLLSIDFDDSNNTATGAWSLALMGTTPVNGTTNLSKIP